MNQIIELIAPVGSGGQAEPSPGGDLLYGVLERGSRYVVALVDDDEPVARRQLRDVVATGEGLEHGNINYSMSLGTAAAELAGLDAEELNDASAPLVSQSLTIDQNQR
jgi:hypothetical protein